VIDEASEATPMWRQLWAEHRRLRAEHRQLRAEDRARLVVVVVIEVRLVVVVLLLVLVGLLALLDAADAPWCRRRRSGYVVLGAARRSAAVALEKEVLVVGSDNRIALVVVGEVVAVAELELRGEEIRDCELARLESLREILHEADAQQG